MTNATTRVQLELPERSMQRLDALKALVGADSYTDVLKEAIRLYESLIQDLEAGNEVLVRKPNGEESAVFSVREGS